MSTGSFVFHFSIILYATALFFSHTVRHFISGRLIKGRIGDDHFIREEAAPNEIADKLRAFSRRDRHLLRPADNFQFRLLPRFTRTYI